MPRSLKTAFQDSTATPYHYAEVTGLEPNTAYAYVALSNGQQAQQSSMQFPVGVGGRLGRRGRVSLMELMPARGFPGPARTVCEGVRQTADAGVVGPELMLAQVVEQQFPDRGAGDPEPCAVPKLIHGEQRMIIV